MFLFTILLWTAIGAASLYVIILFVTGRKHDNWAELFYVGLLMMFVETARHWLLLVNIDRQAILLSRIAVAALTTAGLYAYAHLRLGLDRFREKLLVAAPYPGGKLILYLLFIH